MDEDNLQTSYKQSGFNKYLQRPHLSDTTETDIKDLNYDLTAVSGSLGDKIQVGGAVLGAEEKAELIAQISQETTTNIGETFRAAWPVNSVYISVVSTNPRTVFGFGIWEQIAVGRVLVGVDPTDSAIDTPEKTTGSKYILTANLPAHSHSATQGQHRHEWRGGTSYVYLAGSAVTLSSGGADQVSYSSAANYTDYQTPAISVGNTGSGTAYRPPEFAVYMFKRVK